MDASDIKVVIADLQSALDALRDPKKAFDTAIQGLDRGRPDFGTLPEGVALNVAYGDHQDRLYGSVGALQQAIDDFAGALYDIKKAYEDAEGQNVTDAQLLQTVAQALAPVNSVLDGQQRNAAVNG